LSSLLLSADASARRIVEEAEARARDHLAEIDRRSRWVEAEAARLASWSRQTEKLIQTMSTAFADFRKDVESIPRQVNEALAPLRDVCRLVDARRVRGDGEGPVRLPEV